MVAVAVFERLDRHAGEACRFPWRHVGFHQPRCAGVTHPMRRDVRRQPRIADDTFKARPNATGQGTAAMVENCGELVSL